MATVDTAPPSSTLELTDANPVLFTQKDNPKMPSTITVPGSSNFDLTLFNIIATGTVKADVPGSLLLTLYGRANSDGATANPATWLPLASAPAEPIGGTTDLPETMWMIKGQDLMIFPGSGKMQGLFQSNIASNPQGPMDLTDHPGDITDEDPLYIFAVGVSFLPDETPLSRKHDQRESAQKGAGSRAAAETLCTVNLKKFTMDA